MQCLVQQLRSQPAVDYSVEVQQHKHRDLEVNILYELLGNNS
jgi:hypothetical protein